MQKYQSTLYRKVLLTSVQLQTYSMLHTNTRNIYINQCVCMHYHHTGSYALQYSTRTFYGLLPPLNVRFELEVQFKRLKERSPKPHGRSVEVQVWFRGLGGEVWPRGPPSQAVFTVCVGGGGVCVSSTRRKLQEWTLKASSCSECMLLSERRSGSLSSSLVKMADSLGWFLVMRLRRARISVSCRASTEFTFSMPERSGRTEGDGVT